jgi:hypothetical protein
MISYIEQPRKMPKKIVNYVQGEMHYLNMKFLVLINGKILSLKRQILKIKG